MGFRLIAIGASKGGVEAIGCLLEGLPPAFPVPLAVVQHRGKRPDDGLALLLEKHCALLLLEAEDKEPILPGRVYLAPSDYHLLVDGDHFALSTEAPVGYSRPSIDVLFESAADALGPGVIGVVLTGTGQDGALGAARIKAYGGLVLVEDPATAEAGAMPEAALKAAKADQVLELSQLAPALISLCWTREEGSHG